MEAVVLHRVRFLDYFCPKQGQDEYVFTTSESPSADDDFFFFTALSSKILKTRN